MLDSTDRVKRKVFIISNMKFLVDQLPVKVFVVEISMGNERPHRQRQHRK